MYDSDKVTLLDEEIALMRLADDGCPNHGEQPESGTPNAEDSTENRSENSTEGSH